MQLRGIITITKIIKLIFPKESSLENCIYTLLLSNAGEAIYVDDIPAPKNCLYGEFIYSTQPLANVKSIKFKPSLASKKIITVVSAKDIPTGGRNIGSTFWFGDEEPLFGDPIAEFARQALGVVVLIFSYFYYFIQRFKHLTEDCSIMRQCYEIYLWVCCFSMIHIHVNKTCSLTQIAETQRYADMAAKQAVVEYTTDGLKAPILTVEQAVQSNSYFQVPPERAPKQVGDFSNGMAEADHKIMSEEVCF